MADGSLRCPRCGSAAGKRVAAITGSIMGDEETETYYFCGACEVYYIEYFRDSFTLGESVQQSGELSKAEGDARIAVIRRCETPWDKHCRCEAHKEYFDGWLD